MIHLSEYVKLVELETLQEIVESHGQNSYLEEKMISSQPKVYATQHFCLKFYASHIICSCI